MGSVASYARLVKFSHTVFALPFALLAAFLAGASHGAWYPGAGAFWGKLALVLACMVSARSAAMAFNRVVDFRLDAANPRTAGRCLQTGRITRRQAWWFYGGCCAAFVAACSAFWWVFGNPWPIVAAAPLLAGLSFYSLTKRFTALCHLLLGAALGLSAPAAWIAVSPETAGWACVALACAVLCWVAGFDILYALQDIAFDLAHGLHSIPAALGPANALWISRALHLTCVTCLVLTWRLARTHLGWIYLGGVAAAAGVLLVEQMLVSPRNFSRVNVAFLTCNRRVSQLLGAARNADVLIA